MKQKTRLSNPKGPLTGLEHVIRGGAFKSEQTYFSPEKRNSYLKYSNDIGFRCVMDIKDTEKMKQ